MKGLIFSYEILNKDLELTVQNASLITRTQGIDTPESISDAVNRQLKTVNLWQEAEKKWGRFSLAVSISGERDDLEPFYQSGGTLTASLTTTCRHSNLRKSFILEPSPTNRYLWSGEIELDRREIFGIVKMKGSISGKAGGREHRYLAETNEWTIYLDTAYMPQISGSLPVRWVDFALDKNFGDLRKFSNEPYYVNLELPIPELYLNKSFVGLPELFSDQSRPTGSRLAVHETLRSAIAKSVWLTLFQTSLDAVVIGDDGEEPSLPEQDWQISVLQQILPKIYPGSSLEAALQRVVQDKKSGDMRQVETIASAVIGRDIVREGKAVRTAVHNLELEYGGE